MQTAEPEEMITVTFPTPAEPTPFAPVRRLVVLPWAVLTITILLVLRSIGTLLEQVQLASGPSFGDIESIASGPSFDFVADTQALLSTWAQAAAGSPAAHDLIAWAARAYTIADTLMIAVYAVLLIQLWRRVRTHVPADFDDGSHSWTRLRQAAHRDTLPYLAAGGAAADLLENVLRVIMVERSIAGLAVPDLLIVASWVTTTAKFLLLVAFGVLVIVLVLDTGRLRQWLRRAGWAAWRLRVAFVSVVFYVLLLLADATGQAVDLVRRWIDDGSGLLSGALSLAAAVLLGLAVWLQARRVVLAGHTGTFDPRREVRSMRRWQLTLAGTAVLVAAVAWWRGWRELFATAAIALVLFGLGLLGRSQRAMADAAARKRAIDAESPSSAEDVLAARRMARVLAITAPVTLLMLTSIAFAPVLIVLPLSGGGGEPRFLFACAFVLLGVAGAPLVALGGWRRLRGWDGAVASVPDSFERRYTAGLAATAIAVVASITGAVAHLPVIGVCTVVATFLATVMLVLGEAQRWAETHTAPPGILVLGLSRMPFAALTVLTMVLASFWLSDGSAHAVHRQRDLPGGLAQGASRSGIGLAGAFDAWVAGNCAGTGHSGQRVPLMLVSAPGGGVRAAYWTSSTLSELLGPDRTEPVPGCAAAPADRIFAMGGASGGSLGVLAYTAGLDSADRPATWYDDQLARPDLLTDPLTWMLTTDLARAFVGFGGEDRAQRLEASFARNVPGLGDDFFAGSWGLGGRQPVMMLTGTQVESGCRLNISGLRLTDAPSRADGAVCTSLGRGDAQSDAPITTDLLDVLCGPEPGSGSQSLSRATAALMSARFPYISPSGQLYGCGDARRTAVVDGGYAENTGIGNLMALWPRLERLIAAHNGTAGNATIVPIFVNVDNHYERVAASGEPGRTVEGLVPPSTQSRPDQLDDRATEAFAAAAFTGPVPGTTTRCDIAVDQGRFVRINPRTSPGLPAPLAWTISQLAVEDLAAQRRAALTGPGPAAVGTWAKGNVTCA